VRSSVHKSYATWRRTVFAVLVADFAVLVAVAIVETRLAHAALPGIRSCHPQPSILPARPNGNGRAGEMFWCDASTGMSAEACPIALLPRFA